MSLVRRVSLVSLLVALWLLLPRRSRLRLFKIIKGFFVHFFSLPPAWKSSSQLFPDKKPALIEINKEEGKEKFGDGEKDLDTDIHSSILTSLPFAQIKSSISTKIINSNKPFEIDILEASEWLKLLLSGDWTEPTQNESVKITKLHITGLDLPFVKGDCNFAGIWTPEEIMSVIRNKYARVKWDARFQDSQIMKFITTNSTISYNIQKGTWPVGKIAFLTIISSEGYCIC
jgi:hypothetical protein